MVSFSCPTWNGTVEWPTTSTCWPYVTVATCAPFEISTPHTSHYSRTYATSRSRPLRPSLASNAINSECMCTISHHSTTCMCTSVTLNSKHPECPNATCLSVKSSRISRLSRVITKKQHSSLSYDTTKNYTIFSNINFNYPTQTQKIKLKIKRLCNNVLF